jgi:hypothetical protein
MTRTTADRKVNHGRFTVGPHGADCLLMPGAAVTTMPVRLSRFARLSCRRNAQASGTGTPGQ